MISSNCTLTLPQQDSRLDIDDLGNPVPVALPDLQIRAWMHEIRPPKSENELGVRRDHRWVRGHTIESRPSQLSTGATVKIAFDNGVEGTITLRDRVLGDSEMLGLLAGDQVEGEFFDNTQR